ncbi:unnamed protein product [Mesocestoides corti]|uniref:Uncharacterized protein n=1 Tax=Mesocestoides corti TaxID=53468 RepID=A0A0R3U8S3_MESCO|nr:unnamed protein product [Mesocestoides corti]
MAKLVWFGPQSARGSLRGGPIKASRLHESSLTASLLRNTREMGSMWDNDTQGYLQSWHSVKDVRIAIGRILLGRVCTYNATLIPVLPRIDARVVKATLAHTQALPLAREGRPRVDELRSIALHDTFTSAFQHSPHMDVTGTDPRARTGLFLWPWAATGYPNMPSSNAGPINPQSTPPLGLSSPPMSGGGGFEQGLQHQQQQQDTSLESFYSRLPYSAGGPVPSLQQMQQHQRQQREAAAAAAAVAVSEMQGINNQSGVNRMSATGQHQPPHAPPLAPPPPPPPPPPPFDQRTLMNGRQQQQQQPPTINSASSSPLNSGAYHNPPISPGAQQQQVSQQQFQRHYSSTGSLQNASSSPLDGRISSSASPSVSSAPSYCLKRPSNEFNSATAMALALQAVAKGDRQMQPPPPMHVPPSSSVAEHLQGGGGPGGGDVFASMNSNYLFQPSMSKGPGGGLHGRGSTEAAAMAAAMAAQAARDAANEMVVDPRSAAAGGHPLGLHAGGFLPDFLSGETKLDPTGGVGLRGGFGSVDGTPTMGGGLGMMDGLPGIYGHAAKGYKCKICQHCSYAES